MERSDISHKSEFDPPPLLSLATQNGKWWGGLIPTNKLCRLLDSITCVVIKGG